MSEISTIENSLSQEEQEKVWKGAKELGDAVSGVEGRVLMKMIEYMDPEARRRLGEALDKVKG